MFFSADFVSETDLYFEIGSRVESSHMPIHLSIRGKQKKLEKETHQKTKQNKTKNKKQKQNKKREREREKEETITNIKWNNEKVEV